jgi:hypothetical protein
VIPAARSAFWLDLPLLYIVVLALLTLPRVVAHDLRLIEIDGPLYTALAIAPLLVWLLVAVFRKSKRPIVDFLVLGLAYGVFLGLTHQILWDASWAGDPPHIGGNLAGKLSPLAENLVLRAFSLGSSIATGIVLAPRSGLVAFLATRLRDRHVAR